MTDMKLTTKVPDDIFVAMGSRRSEGIVHYYLTEEDFRNGRCLCGRHVNPDKRFTHWDTQYDLSKEHTCKLCDMTLRIALVLLESQRKYEDKQFKEAVESFRGYWFSASELAAKLKRNPDAVERDLRQYSGCVQSAVENVIMYRYIQLEDVIQMINHDTNKMQVEEEPVNA